MKKFIGFMLTMAFLISLLAIVPRCTNNNPGSNSYVPVTRFDPTRDPALDIQKAVVEAQRTDKRILLDVGGDWCSWCHKLDQFFENNQDVKDFMLQNYIVVKINFSKENRNEEVLSRYPKIPGYPHLFVLDMAGNLLHSQDTAQLESGDGHDRDKVFTFLKTWAKS